MHRPADKARAHRSSARPGAASARAAEPGRGTAPGSFYAAGPAVSLGAPVQARLAAPAQERRPVEEAQPPVQTQVLQLCDCDHGDESGGEAVQQQTVQLWDCTEYTNPTCVQSKADPSEEQGKCAACAAREQEQVQQKCAACAAREQVQNAGTPVRSPRLIQSEARRGIQGASQPLPHADRLQSAFGRHDLSQVRVNIGGGAGSANRRMGALAFTSGDRIGFRQPPSLHLAAHEAAHVVQQREGLSLPNNVGRAGDRWERHADRVADAVVAGRSAEGLLNEVATPAVPLAGRAGRAADVAAARPGVASAEPGGAAPSGAAVQRQITSRAARLIEPAQVPAEQPAPVAGGAGLAAASAGGAAQPGAGAGEGSAIEAAQQSDSEAPPEGVAANGGPAGGASAAAPGEAPATPPAGGAAAGGAAGAGAAAGAPAPAAGPTPAAAGGQPAAGAGTQTTARAAASKRCYNVDPPPPPSNTPEPSSDNRGSEAEAKPQVTFDPWPAEADTCPAEQAVAQGSQQMPEGIGASGAGSAQRTAAPAAASATPAASAAATASPASATPAASTGGATPASSGTGASDSAAAGGGAAQAGPQAAPTEAGPSTAADSAMDGQIANAESERDAAVGSYLDAAATLGPVTARAHSLASGVSFAPASGSRQFAARQAALSLVRDFMARMAGQIDSAAAFAQDQAPGRLGGLAEATKANIQGAMETEKAAISARIAQSRALARSGAAGARAHIRAEYSRSAAAIEAATLAAITALDTTHTTSLQQVDQKETTGLADVNSRFATGRTQHEAKGPEYANRAIRRGQEYADVYEDCKNGYKDDGFWDGCLTVRRAKAQQDAACKTAAGYKDVFLRTANKKGYDLIALRRQYRCAVIAGARQVNQTLDDTHSQLVSGLETGRAQAMQGIATARDQNLAAVNRALAATLNALSAQERAQRQAVNDTGYLKQLAVEQLAHSGAAGLARGISAAMDTLDQTLEGLRDRFAEGDIPEPAALRRSLAATEAALGAGMGSLLGAMEQGAQQAEGQIAALGGVTLGALTAITSQNDQLCAQAEGGFAQQIGGLMAGATTTFGTLTQNHVQQTQRAQTEGSASMRQAVAGFDQALATIGGRVDGAIATSLQELDRDLGAKLGELDGQIDREAWKAAEKEQPAWKSVVAIVLIIVVIIAAAVISIVTLGAGASLFAVILVGALVGAVSGGLIQLINNWASGEAWHQGLAQAMIMGAIGGAIGGGLGFAGGALSAGAAAAGARVATQFAIQLGADLVSEGLTQTAGYLLFGQKFNWQGFVMAGAMSGVSFRAHPSGPRGAPHVDAPAPRPAAGGSRRAAVAQVAAGAAVGLGIEATTAAITGEKFDPTRAASAAASGAVGARMSRRGVGTPHAPEQPTSRLGRAAESIRNFDPGGVGARLEKRLQGVGGRLVGGPPSAETPATVRPQADEAPAPRPTEEAAPVPRPAEEAAPTLRPTEDGVAPRTTPREDAAAAPRRPTADEPESALPRGDIDDSTEGGTRGRDVYRVPVNEPPKKGKAGGVDPRRVQEEAQRIAGIELAHDAQVSTLRGVKDRLQLVIPNAGDPSAPHTVVKVKIEVGGPDDLIWKASAGGVHGGDEGPARLLSLTRLPNGEWEARVILHQGLRSDDLHLVLQHELNEIASILARNPSATQADIQRETAAGVFQRGGSGEPTAHDHAAARELAALYNDLENARGAHRPKPDELADKQARIDRMLRAMGLDDPAAITPAQRAELTAAGISQDVLADLLRGDLKTRRDENFKSTITDFREASPMMSASGGTTAAGHARSKHWDEPTARARVIATLNNPERVFTGVYEASGRQVDIYWRDNSVVITEAGQKGVVVTSYGPAFEAGSSPVDPSKWSSDPDYQEVPTS